MSTTEHTGWAIVALVLVAGAIPWFLWGSSSTVAGLPLWLWWHVCWMGLASVVFYAFTRYGWGVGVVASEARRDPSAGEAADLDGGSRRG